MARKQIGTEPKNHDGYRFRRSVAALMLGPAAILGAGCTEAPAPAPSTSQTAETNKDVVKENWADYVATVDKYPDAVSAAEYLMGNAEGEGVYSRVLRYAGNRGEEIASVMSIPEGAKLALFGPEPADGYPEQVQNIIDDMNKKYSLFAGAYATTKDMQHPFACEVRYTDITEVSDGVVSGTLEEKCDTRSLPGDNKVNFEIIERINLAQYTDSTTGKEAWVIADITDGKVIAAPHDNDNNVDTGIDG